VRSEPDSNGWIFVHTDMTTRNAARHLAKGYEVQLNSFAKEKRKTGSLSQPSKNPREMRFSAGFNAAAVELIKPINRFTVKITSRNRGWSTTQSFYARHTCVTIGNNSIARVYRERISDDRLLAVVNHVHAFCFRAPQLASGSVVRPFNHRDVGWRQCNSRPPRGFLTSSS
jgi:hypothetical protein